MSQYKYFSDLSEFDLNECPLEIVIGIIESKKKAHHSILLNIMSFFSLRDIIIIGRVNRKLYIVSGDMTLLKKF